MSEMKNRFEAVHTMFEQKEEVVNPTIEKMTFDLEKETERVKVSYTFTKETKDKLTSMKKHYGQSEAKLLTQLIEQAYKQTQF